MMLLRYFLVRVYDKTLRKWLCKIVLKSLQEVSEN